MLTQWRIASESRLERLILPHAYAATGWMHERAFLERD
jgi:hypothetical protein